MTEQTAFQIPSTPAGPQPAGDEREFKGNTSKDVENTSSTTAPEYSPQVEDNAGTEGLDYKSPEAEECVAEFTETFSDKINPEDLPPIEQDIYATQTDPEDRDTMILGSLGMFSGVMPNVFGVYDQRRVYPPFYQILYGPASSNKGMLNSCRQLAQPVEKDIETMNQQEREEYQRQLMEYLALDKAARASMPAPKEPAYKSLWIPANSSATACYQALSDNGGWGVTFETEADTLSIALNTDYGDYSDGLRKAFHHESILYRRRKENEFINIDEPRWAIILTCTPGQIPKLFKSFENGLGSRFVFYGKRSNLFWRDVFAQSDKTIDEVFLAFGQRFKQIYDELKKRQDHPIQVIFSPAQQAQFNKFFSELQLEQVGLYGDDMIACVRRLGLVCFRIAMVLTILRHEGSMPIIELLSQAIACDDRDFNTAMTMVNCLINHTAHVYSEIFNGGKDEKEGSKSVKMSNQESMIFRSLGKEFTTNDVRQAAEELKIRWKTAERYLKNYVSKYKIASRIKNGHYMKIDS